MVHHSHSSPTVAARRPPASSPIIDPRNHLRQRKAVREAVQQVFVTGRCFHDGEVYDVSATRFEQSGLRPAELFLDPIEEP